MAHSSPKPQELLTSHSRHQENQDRSPRGKAGGRGAVSGFGPANPGACRWVWARQGGAGPAYLRRSERGGLPARRVAAVHLLGRHQPLNSLHVPVAASSNSSRAAGSTASAAAPAQASALRRRRSGGPSYSGRRRRRQQQRQQRQQEPRPREQEGEAPRCGDALRGPGLSAPCCHRARRSPMAAPPRILDRPRDPRLLRRGGGTENPPSSFRRMRRRKLARPLLPAPLSPGSARDVLAARARWW